MDMYSSWDGSYCTSFKSLFKIGKQSQGKINTERIFMVYLDSQWTR